MANNCKVDFINKEIIITRKFYTAAQRFGTQEFETLCQLQEKMPNFRVVLQPVRKSTSHTWQPTYSQMSDIIRIKTHDEEAISKLHEVIALARVSGQGYSMVRQWFLENYGATLNENLECAA